MMLKKRIMKPGGVIIEPTYGNTGFGFAMVVAVSGYRMILVVPESMSPERRKIMSAYGAEFDLTPREGGGVQRLKIHCPSLQVLAVEPEASPVLSGGAPGPNPFQGTGAGFIPSILNTSPLDRIIKVGKEEAYCFTKRAAKEEGLFIGISSRCVGSSSAKNKRFCRRDKDFGFQLRQLRKISVDRRTFMMHTRSCKNREGSTICLKNIYL